VPTNSTSADGFQIKSEHSNIAQNFCAVQAMSTYLPIAQAFKHKSAHVSTYQHFARLCGAVQTMSTSSTYADAFQRISTPHQIH
jgi:hypothetical protein